MVLSTPLDDHNIILYAAKHYTNIGQGGLYEFYEDLGRIRNIRRLFRRYAKSGELKERLLVNHIVAMYNVFEKEALTRILVFKLDEFLDYLYPVLLFLGHWPTNPIVVANLHLPLDTVIEADAGIVEKLKAL